jgi:hypothetical protein
MPASLRAWGSGAKDAPEPLPVGEPAGAAKAAGPSATADRSPLRVEPDAKASGGNPFRYRKKSVLESETEPASSIAKSATPSPFTSP